MIEITRKKRNPDRKLLILDIDNTIIYLNDGYDNILKDYDFLYKFGNKEYPIIKRPYLDKFLKEISKKI